MRLTNSSFITHLEQDMTNATQHTHGSMTKRTPPPTARASVGMLARVESFIGWIRQWRQRSEDRAIVGEMTAAQARDIGLDRSDPLRDGNRYLWRL